jgi:hypothetical protein
MWIKAVAFRPDAQTGDSFSATLPNVQINLSTTAKGPDTLSTTFASNVGLDDTTVFSGALVLSSGYTGPAGGPKDFDIVITLAIPFRYDPASGNLLLDVRNFSGGYTTQFDANSASGGPVGRAFSVSSNGVYDLTGGSGPNGLVTRFEYSPVPEPATLTLGMLAAAGLAGYNWRRRKKA